MAEARNHRSGRNDREGSFFRETPFVHSCVCGSGKRANLWSDAKNKWQCVKCMNKQKEELDLHPVTPEHFHHCRSCQSGREWSCPNCHGEGEFANPGDLVPTPCTRCGGSGRVRVPSRPYAPSGRTPAGYGEASQMDLGEFRAWACDACGEPKTASLRLMMVGSQPRFICPKCSSEYIKKGAANLWRSNRFHPPKDVPPHVEAFERAVAQGLNETPQAAVSGKFMDCFMSLKTRCPVCAKFHAKEKKKPKEESAENRFAQASAECTKRGHDWNADFQYCKNCGVINPKYAVVSTDAVGPAMFNTLDFTHKRMKLPANESIKQALRWVQRKGKTVQFGNVVGPHIGHTNIYELPDEGVAKKFEAHVRSIDGDGRPAMVNKEWQAFYKKSIGPFEEAVERQLEALTDPVTTVKPKKVKVAPAFGTSAHLGASSDESE